MTQTKTALSLEVATVILNATSGGNSRDRRDNDRKRYSPNNYDGSSSNSI